MKKRKTPAIRFKGFTDDWEQYELGNLSSQIKRKNQNNSSKLPLTISAEYGLVSQTTYFNNQVASKNLTNYYLIRNGEFAYNKSTSEGYPYGAIKRLDYYDKGVLSSLYIIFAIKKENENYCIDSNFLSFFFGTDNWHNHIANCAAEGARNHGLLNISANDFFKLKLFSPKSINEQQQIGTFFNKLDNLITFHQRKYEKLKIIKKALLEKMFPKNGAKVPEIRFENFTSAWEQYKLEKYLETSNQKNENNFFTRENVLSVSGELGIVNQIEFKGRSFAGASINNYNVVNLGDVVYTKSPLNRNPFGIIKTNKQSAGIVSTLYAVYKPKNNVNSHFIQTYFEQDYRINSYLYPLVNKGAKNDMKISNQNALKGFVIFPELEEQCQICSLFKCLDFLITLHQRKIEKLQTIKKAMLEKMFI